MRRGQVSRGQVSRGQVTIGIYTSHCIAAAKRRPRVAQGEALRTLGMFASNNSRESRRDERLFRPFRAPALFSNRFPGFRKASTLDRVGGGVAPAVPPHHRTYALTYPAILSGVQLLVLTQQANQAQFLEPLVRHRARYRSRPRQPPPAPPRQHRVPRLAQRHPLPVEELHLRPIPRGQFIHGHPVDPRFTLVRLLAMVSFAQVARPAHLLHQSSRQGSCWVRRRGRLRLLGHPSSGSAVARGVVAQVRPKPIEQAWLVRPALLSLHAHRVSSDCSLVHLVPPFVRRSRLGLSVDSAFRLWSASRASPTTRTTMASADFSAPSRRVPTGSCEGPSLAATEISQGKCCLLGRVPAGSTGVRPLEYRALRSSARSPRTTAFDPIPVRRYPGPGGSASFRFRLATDTLASPCGSAQYGPRRTSTSSNNTCLAHATLGRRYAAASVNKWPKSNLCRYVWSSDWLYAE